MWEKNKILSRQKGKNYLNYVNKANIHQSSIYAFSLRRILKREVKGTSIWEVNLQ